MTFPSYIFIKKYYNVVTFKSSNSHNYSNMIFYFIIQRKIKSNVDKSFAYFCLNYNCAKACCALNENLNVKK